MSNQLLQETKQQIVIIEENGTERVFVFNLNIIELKGLDETQRKISSHKQAELHYSTFLNCEVKDFRVKTMVAADGCPRITNNEISLF